MVTLASPTTVDHRVAQLDTWLEGMRGPGGYTGPVVHWWRNSLVFCGAGLDWRYEGIICGYVTLYRRTGEEVWLGKARRAADDLVEGQLPSGHYRDSRFELNPGPGGTPHEAAADVGLLTLARALRDRGDADWQAYFDVAERNLRESILGRLWDSTAGWIGDDPAVPSFVPNKAATAIEALCLLAELTGDEEIVERYVRPTALAILAHQERSWGSPLDGAIAQNSLRGSVVRKYFPFYNARCVPGLLAAYHYVRDARLRDAALRAMAFVDRWRELTGAYPQVIYADGRVNRYPQWIAAVGDVLRAADLVREYGLECTTEPTLAWLMAGQLPTGAVATAHGFALQIRAPARAAPDLRDLLPACGWVDKAFRYLTTRVTAPEAGPLTTKPMAAGCTFRGREGELVEDQHALVFRRNGRPAWRWQKGERWAEIAAPWAVLT